MNAMQYRAIYRVDSGKPSQFEDRELLVDHLPRIGTVVEVPDGSGQYGRVIAVERV